MNLKIIKKQPKKFLSKVEDWLRSDSPYIIRFAIVILLSYFLDKEFNSKILDTVANITSQHYYVKMAVAWFFSIALIKQYDKTVVYLENRSLSKFIHNKTIQKALESYRISVDKKLYLKELKY